MKKITLQFLIITFAIGYLSFGTLVLLNVGFGEILSEPLLLFLLGLGQALHFISNCPYLQGPANDLPVLIVSSTMSPPILMVLLFWLPTMGWGLSGQYWALW